ncbi:MAG: WecB/TagA/CpsF family glycosyltransferase [Ignavibacterium sp.]|nr:WecB/TagA/CpsF family glycosyltransferase [Ignavibacterium sp.]
MNKKNSIELFGTKFSNISYDEIIDAIQFAIQTRNQIAICYANVHSINLSINQEKLKQLLSEFDILHPDGFGVYLGSKILFGRNGFSYRQNGSDLYERIIEKAILNDWKLFIFGDTDETLDKIKFNYSGLSLVGLQNGYAFDNEKLLNEINKNKPDILIIGLGSPKQEEWIVTLRDKINTNVIIAVGDGIKVFAGNKRRGPKFVQVIGFEWLVRLISEPKRLWKRYIVGIPLFIIRILKYKLFKQ